MNDHVIKHWVEIRTKKEYSKYGIHEMVGIFYNPYNKTVKEVIKMWIVPEFINQVYGRKTE
jgi:hypothetical protein